VAEVILDQNMGQSGQLPLVCIYCGARATAVRQRTFTGRTPITLTVGRGFLRARLPTCDSHCLRSR
jgi:hypothetical protein